MIWRLLSSCLLACLPACLLACLPACLLACLPACLLACLPACLLACLPACLLACFLSCLAPWLQAEQSTAWGSGRRLFETVQPGTTGAGTCCVPGRSSERGRLIEGPGRATGRNAARRSNLEGKGHWSEGFKQCTRDAKRCLVCSGQTLATWNSGLQSGAK